MKIKFTLHFQGEEREDDEMKQKKSFKDTFFQDLGKELKLQESESE